MTKIAFVSSERPEAKNSLKILKRMYTNVSPEKADIIVALGGDGTILKSLHSFLKSKNKEITNFVLLPKHTLTKPSREHRARIENKCEAFVSRFSSISVGVTELNGVGNLSRRLACVVLQKKEPKIS